MTETTSYDPNHKLSFIEKAGYSMGDAAANFVFMTMILFQTNFYTDVMGISAATAGAILLFARLWDAFFDPLMGVLADRTRTRWGRFRPWILFTAIPWCIVMVLAYTTPKGWSTQALVTYAAVTNILLMTLYSCNNMPYAALGGVMTGDIQERAKLNSFRFISVNIAQFIVGGFTLPLVAKFSLGHDRQYGWQMTMTVWSVLCLVMFLITFATTRERVQPVTREKTPPGRDFADLLRNSPWIVMFLMTLTHFAILSFRGGALYNYYHHYADKGALYDWVQSLGLVAKPGETSTGILEWLGYIVHGDRANLEGSNVADVANSIVNMIGTAVTVIVLLMSPALSNRFGKKAVAVVGFGLSALGSLAFYLPGPTAVGSMLWITIAIAVVYAPTIPLIWAIYADVADYSEWKNKRRATGIIFATIGFGLKSGLALGSASFLWIMKGVFEFDSTAPVTPKVIEGFRVCSSLVVGVLFAVCTLLLIIYKLNKKLTIQIADELSARRKGQSAAT